MDAYVFIQTEPGLAGPVMETLVSAKLAERVVAVSGKYDLIARVRNVDLAAMTGRLLEGVHRVPGVLRSNTAFMVALQAVAPDIRGIPWVPYWLKSWPAVVGLVLVDVQAGSGADVVRSLTGSRKIMGLALLTGEHDLMVQVGGASLEDVADIVLNTVQPLAGVWRTETMIVLGAVPPPERQSGPWRPPAAMKATTAGGKKVRKSAKRKATRKALRAKPARRSARGRPRRPR